MSDTNTNKASNSKKTKFTKGEKCIFIHAVATFVLIIVFLLIYFIHLYLVNHKGNEYLRITRRIAESARISEEVPNTWSIGVVYLNITDVKLICNSLLLKQRWSLVPAHCVVVRSDPDLAYLLPRWKIKYQTIENDDMDTDIKRGVVHPYYNNDDMENNIGLFEHVDLIYSETYKFNNIVVNDDNDISKYQNKMSLIRRIRAYYTINRVRPLTMEKCSQFVSPIVDRLRKSEFCVVGSPKLDLTFEHGAALMIDSEIVGFFSWGDRNGIGVPYIILNITPFRNWLEYAVTT